MASETGKKKRKKEPVVVSMVANDGMRFEKTEVLNATVRRVSGLLRSPLPELLGPHLPLRPRHGHGITKTHAEDHVACEIPVHFTSIDTAYPGMRSGSASSVASLKVCL